MAEEKTEKKVEKKPADNRTAVQKIADLENAVMQLFHINDTLARDLMTLKEGLKLLDNKVNSIVKATSAGEPLTDAVLSRIMVENNVEELSKKVSSMVDQGFLVKEDQVSENSFVVGSEEDEDGVVKNPRLQFALKALNPNYQAKLLNKLSGEVVSFEEGKLRFKILESYSIQEPKAPTAPVLEVVPELPAEPTAPAQAENVTQQ